MTNAHAIKDILRNPAARRVWVRAQLRLRGMSLRRIAEREGVSHQAVSAALIVPSERLEAVLAAELGMRVQDLFPDRYDRHGIRTVRTNPNAAHIRRNVKGQGAA